MLGSPLDGRGDFAAAPGDAHKARMHPDYPNTLDLRLQ